VDNDRKTLTKEIITMFEYSIAFFIAIGIGLIASFIGMGGGFLYVPTLTLIFGINPKVAVGTSLAISVFAACAATFCYQGQQKILISTALVMIIPSIIFAFLGSALTVYVHSRFLALLFVIALLFIALQMFWPTLPVIRKITFGPVFVVSVAGKNGNDQPLRIPFSHLFIWGAMGGLISGTTGISGGVFFVPALVAVGVPIHFAVATSLLTIIPTSITGAATHAALGHISLPFLIVFGIGAAIGAYGGASMAPKIHADQIRRFFGILLIMIALLMIQQKVLGG
jgi:uncharacterized protein